MYGALVLGGLWLLFGLDVAVPDDTGTWSPESLPGEVVHSLAESPGALLAGTESGLYELRPGSAPRRVPGMPGRVYALTRDGEEVHAGTAEGVYTLPSSGIPERRGLEGRRVNSLDVSEGRLHAATDGGLYREVRQGDWDRVWPVVAEACPVNAIVATSGGVLAGTEEGILRVREDAVESLWDRSAVVHLTQIDPEPGTGKEELWAGLRGGAQLLRSENDGTTWSEAGGDVGLQAVNALVPDPAGGGRLYIGGSGLADGDGTAGVMTSDDGGETWQTEQNRLSNTHVLSLAARRERLAVELSLPPLLEARSLALPASGTRFYAGTNGSGVYAHRPLGPAFSLFEILGAGARFAEPLIFGLLLLVVGWKLYHGRRYPGRRRPGRT